MSRTRANICSVCSNILPPRAASASVFPTSTCECHPWAEMDPITRGIESSAHSRARKKASGRIYSVARVIRRNQPKEDPHSPAKTMPLCARFYDVRKNHTRNELRFDFFAMRIINSLIWWKNVVSEKAVKLHRIFIPMSPAISKFYSRLEWMNGMNKDWDEHGFKSMKTKCVVFEIYFDQRYRDGYWLR